jgi:hypothetical protein
MYKKADDIKSNLILNTLSWVDFLRPDLCYFENVPGFLSFSFDSVQAGVHRTEGGTEMGGMKFLVRGLLDMRQVFTNFFRSNPDTSTKVSSSLWSLAGRQLWHSPTPKAAFYHCGEAQSPAA